MTESRDGSLSLSAHKFEWRRRRATWLKIKLKGLNRYSFAAELDLAARDEAVPILSIDGNFAADDGLGS
jgi:hypothetical protein